MTIAQSQGYITDAYACIRMGFRCYFNCDIRDGAMKLSMTLSCVLYREAQLAHYDECREAIYDILLYL
jgi:hypothetical protein